MPFSELTSDWKESILTLLAGLTGGVKRTVGGRPLRMLRCEGLKIFLIQSKIAKFRPAGGLMKSALLTIGAGLAAGALVAGTLQNHGTHAADRSKALPAAQPQLENVAYLPDPAVQLDGLTAPTLEGAAPGSAQKSALGSAPGSALGSIAAGEGEAPPPALRAEQIKVARGDTLMALLVKTGIDRSQANAAITALREVFDPRNLKIGQEIRLRLREDAAEGDRKDPALTLVSLMLRPSLEQDILLTRQAEGGFAASATERPLERVLNLASGSIDYSLARAAGEAGVPANILIAAIRAFSYDVDFQRDIQPGDAFELFYETFEDAEGRRAKTGQLLYGAMTLSGVTTEIFLHSTAGGESDYFDPKGQSVRKALLRTPIDGARISSGFGKRKHPILGYTKMHRGVDFAAPRGTPVYAAGTGVIEYAGRNGAYGKYIRIRHGGSFKTAYAHLKGYAKGIARGKRVKQGQVIGYVGSTGRSTGPHLHYEVLRDGKQTNPRNMKLPAGPKLAGEPLEQFQAARAEIDRLRATAEVRQVVQAKK